MKIVAYGKTDVGKFRELNEDNFLISNEHSLFMVADGMGGHAAGEIASTLAVTTISGFLESHSKERDHKLPQEFITEAIQRANRKIHEEASSREDRKGMGTTVVTAFVQDNYAYIAHVGDSRAYLVRQNALDPLTSDHSWVNFQVQIGNITAEQAKYHPLKNIITKALGISDSVEVEMSKLRLLDNDVVLLCSDGLTGMVGDTEILRIVNEHTPDDLQGAVDALIAEALKNGGEDNVTVILLKFIAPVDDNVEDTQPISYDSDIHSLPTTFPESKGKSLDQPEATVTDTRPPVSYDTIDD